MTEDTPSAVRQARNESVLRERNERLEPYNAAQNWVNPPFADWTCECADESCAEPVQLTISEYERVRAEPTHFLIAPSLEHVAPAVEQVVRQEDRYWVVEKVGVAAEVSEHLDPRSDQ